MPEATSRICGHLELRTASVRTESDGENYADFVTGQCLEPADHFLVLSIEGAPKLHVDYLCCRHRCEVVDELAHGESLGVTLVADKILAPEFAFQVRRGLYGWECIVVVTSAASGASHRLPPAQLHAASREEAEGEALEIVTRLRESAREQS